MVEAQRIQLRTSSAVELFFAAESAAFITPGTAYFGGPFLPKSSIIDLATFPIAEGGGLHPDCERHGRHSAVATAAADNGLGQYPMA
jgi:hypothetical protein